MVSWKPVGVVAEGQPIRVGGLNPWNFEWHRMPADPVDLPHPSYPDQTHRMLLYEITSEGKSVTFAAGELSMNVWGFYVQAM